MKNLKYNLLLLAIVGALISCENNAKNERETITAPTTEQTKVYEQFEIDYSLKENTLNISVITDLPENTPISLSVSRSYWEKENSSEYSMDFVSEQSTVGQWKKAREVSLDNQKWKADFASERKKWAESGMGFDVDKISDSITIYAVVISSDSDPIFKEKGMGQSEAILYYPMTEDIEAQSIYENSQTLKEGKKYSVSKSTPLMPEFNPSDPLESIEKIININAESKIKVISIKSKGNTPWYEVKAFDKNDKYLSKGWINSTALIGQNLKIIK